MKLTINRVIERFNVHSPECMDDIIHKCKVPLRYIDSGVYRRVYHIVGLPLVVKCVYRVNNGQTSFLKHSDREARLVRDILRKKAYQNVKKYMPKIYYTNRRGITVMHKYTELAETVTNEKAVDKISKALGTILGVDKGSGFGLDLHLGNVGKDEKGRLVIFDLGCVREIHA